MHTKWVFNHFGSRSKKWILVLLSLWILSLIVGILLCNLSAMDADNSYCTSLFAAPTPLGLLLVYTLPIAAVSFALQLPISAPFYFVISLTGISFGFTGAMVYLVQGSAAWLLRPMLLFSGGCASVLMWWLILKPETRRRRFPKLRLVAILSCISFVVDLFIVSPLLDDLL